MKRNFTLAIIILLVIKANAQVMLNEVYPIPGAGRHEFFELFNNGTGSAPVSMDHYTLITYFEEAGNQTGFYVLDLPDMPVPSQSYFVGASATPFNYQGINNSNSAQFSWNDSAFLNVNNGYLKKWYASSNIPAAIDGNDYYDLAATPANLNNFFYKVGGGNASYGVFLYRGGTLVNCFLGGVGGSNNMPSYILSMPLLHINMMGSAPDFDIVFSGYTNTPFESVTQEVGTDNGYIRLRDGFCGSWNKSSATVNHTPGFTNGGSGFEAATISVAAVVVPGNATTGSNANYDVVGAPVTSFPITMQIITDVGTSPSLLDAGDTLAGQNTENIITDGPFTTNFFPHKAHILIVVYTNAGCIDRIMAIPNIGVLPIKLTSFKGKRSGENVHLEWVVESNEEAQSFTIQSSEDGKNFKPVKIISSTNKTGQENYSFSNQLPKENYYRIQIKDASNKISYSNIVYLEGGQQESKLVVISDPGESTIRFRYKSTEQTMATVTIYNASGSKIHERMLQLTKGEQNIILPTDHKTAGVYILEVSTLKNRQVCRFVKQ